jgi:uncharacterized C2H2 Zn-finger protein
MKFYSQTLGTAQTLNFCARCERRFERWDEYHRHVTIVTCALKIKPIRTTSRSKTEIVADWEARQKEGAIIQ